MEATRSPQDLEGGRKGNAPNVWCFGPTAEDTKTADGAAISEGKCNRVRHGDGGDGEICHGWDWYKLLSLFLMCRSSELWAY